MHIILTGATGLVGLSVLDAMIKAKDITKISILSRKPVQMADDAKDSRINVIIHRDFNTYDAKVLEQLRGAEACVWALGISQTRVNAQEYVTITKDYALAAAKSFATLSTPSSEQPFRFIYVSARGATQQPGRFSPFYARVKGETEADLSDMAAAMPKSLWVGSVRPIFVDARQHAAILPYIPDPGVMYKVTGGAASLLLPLMRGIHSPTEQLGDFLTRMAMGKLDSQLEGAGASRLGGSWIIENLGFRRIMGL
ncbi:nucleoside-diphosphate-sugar epimerase [Trichoderma cornu-damae]|uniref:Nucleoside-diphosphate-sugar epimerase n=1 Tax=Trichoderma cornu-damae TaxID=654480 RepID=A0A9P8TYQ6_9HYPO|nr:nucleoside-diphosphate-sugar epimerase [Trichoderma cornu-damae]